MSRKVKDLVMQSLKVALIVALATASFTGYIYFYNSGRQACVQEISSGYQTCHDPKPGEHPGTVFVFNPHP
jgi:hypothetical protein